MIRIQQLKLPITHSRKQLLKKIAKTLRIRQESVVSYTICKQSIDARRKSEVSFVYTIDVSVDNEEDVLRRVKGKQISLAKEVQYQFPRGGEKILKYKPVIIGSGPAGLFCAYLLAEYGFCT